MMNKLIENMEGAPSLSDQEELLDLETAADQLCVSKTTLYRMLDRGEVKGSKVGRQWRIRRGDIEAYLVRGPVAVALTSLPVAVVDAEIAAIAEQLLQYQEPLPTVAAPSLDVWEEKVQQLLLAVVRLAVVQRATDIHLEPVQEGTDLLGLLRFRIDGFLHTIHRLPHRVHDALIVRGRLLANSSADNKSFLDASLHLPIAGETVDLRVSILSSYLGQALSARLLSVTGNGPLGLASLGFHPDDLERVTAWMQPQAGIILVNGPSGSGKTTLLYRLLELAVDQHRKVVSIEDPVEQLLPGVMQVEINRQTRDFASVLRALLRHDVDTVMVAELRDLETINLSFQAARMGHHVLAPLSLDNALGTLHRVLEVFSTVQQSEIRQVMAQTIQGIISMRLTRLLCTECKSPRALPPALQDELATFAASTGAVLPSEGTYHQPVGCVHCAHTGFRGRTGIYEVVEMTPELREAFLHGASREEITRQYQGARTLVTEALRKAAEGLISLDEVLPLIRRHAQPAS